VVHANVGEMGHLDHAEVTRMRQHAGIEMRQQRGPEGVGIGCMDKVPRKARPGVHLQQEVAELDTRQALGDAFG
jgi:hypothetical protein